MLTTPKREEEETKIVIYLHRCQKYYLWPFVTAIAIVGAMLLMSILLCKGLNMPTEEVTRNRTDCSQFNSPCNWTRKCCGDCTLCTCLLPGVNCRCNRTLWFARLLHKCTTD